MGDRNEKVLTQMHVTVCTKYNWLRTGSHGDLVLTLKNNGVSQTTGDVMPNLLIDDMEVA